MNKGSAVASIGFVLACLAAGPADAACFTIYNPQNTPVYQSTEPPIDLSKTISSQLAARYPRHHLVMAANSNACPTLRPSGQSAAQPAGAMSGQILIDSPLFSNAPNASSAIGRSDSYPPSGSDRSVPGNDVSGRPYTPVDGTFVATPMQSAPSRRR